ncbi:MAG: lipoyl(octanoyl) transferase LipB [Mariprofundaceae bacterium]
MHEDMTNSATIEVVRHQCQSYPDSIAEQEKFVSEVLQGERSTTLIFTEHPPVFTLGTSGNMADVLNNEIDGETIEVFESGRGGEVTYHGPGQLVCYVIADVSGEQDLHKHVWRLEEMVIRSLADFGIKAQRDDRGIGVWVDGLKIAAVGVRCRKWVTYHGIALNINPKMKHFKGIVTCGMKDQPVTSLSTLGIDVGRREVERAVLHHAGELFGLRT